MLTGVPILTTSLVVRTRIECRKNPAARQAGQAGPPHRMVSLEMNGVRDGLDAGIGDACLAQRDQVMRAVECLRQKTQSGRVSAIRRATDHEARTVRRDSAARSRIVSRAALQPQPNLLGRPHPDVGEHD